MIKVLLKYDARLGSLASEKSELQYACDVAVDGCLELLCVLLRAPTRRNVSLKHGEVLKTQYGHRESGTMPPEGPRRVQRRGRVFRQLSDFTDRALQRLLA